MELNQIRAYLDSPDTQDRMRAIVELRHYSPDVVVPLLKLRMYDKEFVVRSFVAMGLGKKQSDEAFNALLDLIEYDSDYNVVAEAANSLSKYGDKSLPYLLKLFQQKPHWLVRQSILAAMEDVNHPETILQLCIWGVEGDDLVVKLAAIANLRKLADTNKADEAQAVLLDLVDSQIIHIRAQVARVLYSFDSEEARAALVRLGKDEDYRVVGATLEGLI